MYGFLIAEIIYSQFWKTILSSSVGAKSVLKQGFLVDSGNYCIPEYSIVRACCYRNRRQLDSIGPDFFCKQTRQGDYNISHCKSLSCSRSNNGGSVEHEQSAGNETCRRRGGQVGPGVDFKLLSNSITF